MAKELKIRWLKRALENLDTEAEFIAKDHPQAAQDFIVQVFHQVDLLREHPHLGRIGRIPHTRELVIQGFPYLIPYRVKQETVQLLRVFHTARRYPPSAI